MSRRKRNISMGLVLLLAATCLLGAVGVSLARYRADQQETLLFQVRQPGQVHLGVRATPDEAGIPGFNSQGVSSWKWSNGEAKLDFTVANGASQEDASGEDQYFTVQLVGSLGIGSGAETVAVTLELSSEETEIYQGTASRIQPGTPLYRTYGDGWVFSFLDQAGKDHTWTLEGGRFSAVDLTVTLKGKELAETSLLQPVITGYSM